MTFRTAKWIIGGGWLAVSLGAVAVLMLQSVSGLYEDKVKEVFDWFTPMIAPTIGLVLPVLFSGGTIADPHDRKKVSIPIFGITAFLAAFYLIMLFIVIFTAVYAEKRIEHYHQMSLWLGLIQGLVTSAMAYFFQRKQQ